MKKMEFMREAGKVLMDFCSMLYLNNEFTNQSITLHNHNGTFKIKQSGGFLYFNIYMTGTISYRCASFVGTKCDYTEYYVYNENDDHKQVLKKFKEDLNKLKEYFERLFTIASFEGNPFNHIVFEYDKPFSSSLDISNEDEYEEDDDYE